MRSFVFDPKAWPLFCLPLAFLMVGCGMPRTEEVEDAPKPAEVRCVFTTQEIQVDGVLDEEAWAGADPVSLPFLYKPLKDGRISATSVRLLWDLDTLYVGFVCDDDDIWSYSDEPDDELWLGDVVEVFLKPSRSKLSYCEFVVAPNGTLFDARYPSRGAGGYRRFRNWSSNARVATKIRGSDGEWRDTDIGYTVELAIPISAFSEIAEAPSSGTSWTFGIFRYDYSKNLEKKLLLMSGPNPGKEGFHSYEEYRQLDFR